MAQGCVLMETAALPLKNTFVHFLDPDLEELALLRNVTCPPRLETACPPHCETVDGFLEAWVGLSAALVTMASLASSKEAFRVETAAPTHLKEQAPEASATIKERDATVQLCCRYPVGIQQDKAFDVLRVLLGPGAENLKFIGEESGAKIAVRGRGLCKEPGFSEESDESLVVCVDARSSLSFEIATELLESLLEEVHQQYRNFCSQNRLPVGKLAVLRETDRGPQAQSVARTLPRSFTCPEAPREQNESTRAALCRTESTPTESSNFDVRLSRTLANILRHTALKHRISVRPDGFCPVDDVLTCEWISKLGTTLRDLERITSHNAKKRFEIMTDRFGHKFIRAVQGHSMKIVKDDLLLKQLYLSDTDLPKTCVHGSYSRYLESILQNGLLAGGTLGRGTRNHVHFAPYVPGDKSVISGMRGDCEIAIWLDIKAALRGGLDFFTSTNKVILTPGLDGVVPARFIAKVQDLATGEILYKQAEQS